MFLVSNSLEKDIVESPNCLVPSQMRALADQITGQTNCRSGASIVSPIADSLTLDTSRTVYPYLVKGALESLNRVAVAGSPTLGRMAIIEALTPFLYQYLKFRRGYLRVCQEVFAQPYVGQTANEEGNTVTIVNAAAWEPFFAAEGGWTRSDNSFTYTGTLSINFGRRTIETFQLLWNQAFPFDAIPVTSEFDGTTQNRVEQAYIIGFSDAALCRSNQSTLNNPNDVALLTVILAPILFASLSLMLFLWYRTDFFKAATPLDGNKGNMEPGKPFIIPEPNFQNSVEDTTALSSYASTTPEISLNDEEGEDDDETSGIWG